MYDLLEEILLTEDDIRKRNEELGRQISSDYAGNEIFVMSVLNGSVIILADIVRHIEVTMEYGSLPLP
jgi:hypoxanthine phosphoribosyltransferase